MNLHFSDIPARDQDAETSSPTSTKMPPKNRQTVVPCRKYERENIVRPSLWAISQFYTISTVPPCLVESSFFTFDIASQQSGS